MEEIGDRIKAARQRIGMSQSKLARLLGLSPQAVQKWESKLSVPRIDHLLAVEQALGIEMTELVAGTKFAALVPSGGVPAIAPPAVSIDKETQRLRSLGRVPLIDWDQAAQWMKLAPTFRVEDALGWIPIPFAHGPRAFALHVEGESMYNPGSEKSYAPGDFVAVDPDRPSENRSTVVARTSDGHATLKQLLDDRDGTRMLKSLNPDWPRPFVQFDEETTIIGTLIGRWTPE